MTTTLLVAALIPPLFLMWQVYRMDKVEKEPMKLIVKLFIFGAIMVIPAGFIEVFVIGALTSVMSPYSYFYLFVENFFCVALVEELVKYLALKFGSWKHPAFDYCFDGIVYAVSVSLGFAAAENVMYVMQYGMSNAVMRAVTAIPGHCIFAIFMGYYYGMAKYGEGHGYVSKASTFKKLAVIMPMLLHGFYDFCASSGSDILVMLFFAYIIVLDIFAIRSIRKFQRGDIPVAPTAPSTPDFTGYSTQIRPDENTVDFGGTIEE